MKKTLLIVGAGSSKAIHHSFPTGMELAKLIDVHLINTYKKEDDPTNDIKCPYISSMINEAKKILNLEAPTLDIIVEAFKRPLWGYVQHYYYNEIRTGYPPISIDELISKINDPLKDEITKLAKFSIAYHIKGHERAYSDRLNKLPESRNQNWICYLLNFLKSNNSSINFVEDLAFYTFNYDRVLEFLIQKTLPDIFGSKYKDYGFENIKHLNGSIGTLEELPFHNDNNQLMDDSHFNIKLIGERNTNDFDLNDFQKILLVGFGFDQTNLTKVLKLNRSNKIPSFGMCYESKTDYLKKVEKDYNIQISEYTKIEQFLNKYLLN